MFAGVEGTRPLLVEIQALVAPSALGTPRRAVVGWDANRLSMLLAVLDARCGVSFAGHDVYLNVAGGLRITEPAADLAAAAALVSSLSGVALPRHRVYFGEISLSGAVSATPPWGRASRKRRNSASARRLFPPQGELDTAGIEAETAAHRPCEGACRWPAAMRLTGSAATCRNCRATEFCRP